MTTHTAPMTVQAAEINSRHLVPQARSFSASDWDILARFWHPVIRATDVGERPATVTLLDLELVVYRTPDGLRVARDVCPHRGAPLHQAQLVDGQLVCTYHGLHFGSDGRCTLVPAHPASRPSGRMAMTMFPAVERYGLVWTCLSPDGPSAEIPPFPHWDDPGYQNISPASIDMATSAGRQIEGFIDVAHFAWVHDQSFAERAEPEVPH